MSRSKTSLHHTNDASKLNLLQGKNGNLKKEPLTANKIFKNKTKMDLFEFLFSPLDLSNLLLLFKKKINLQLGNGKIPK